jgi:hypothetical protein
MRRDKVLYRLFSKSGKANAKIPGVVSPSFAADVRAIDQCEDAIELLLLTANLVSAV